MEDRAGEDCYEGHQRESRCFAWHPSVTMASSGRHSPFYINTQPSTSDNANVMTQSSSHSMNVVAEPSESDQSFLTFTKLPHRPDTDSYNASSPSPKSACLATWSAKTRMPEAKRAKEEGIPLRLQAPASSQAESRDKVVQSLDSKVHIGLRHPKICGSAPSETPQGKVICDDSQIMQDLKQQKAVRRSISMSTINVRKVLSIKSLNIDYTLLARLHKPPPTTHKSTRRPTSAREPASKCETTGSKSCRLSSIAPLMSALRLMPSDQKEARASAPLSSVKWSSGTADVVEKSSDVRFEARTASTPHSAPPSSSSTVMKQSSRDRSTLTNFNTADSICATSAMETVPLSIDNIAAARSSDEPSFGHVCPSAEDASIASRSQALSRQDRTVSQSLSMRLIVKKLAFVSDPEILETWAADVYDRRGLLTTCEELSSVTARQIKHELNLYKMDEMWVHPASTCFTHFF